MKNNNKHDWVTGDLLKVVREHYFVKADADGVWPDVFSKETHEYFRKTTEGLIKPGTVVMALDSKPPAGSPAVIRVLYNNSVWVANSNYVTNSKYVTKELCITANQEKCLL